MKQQSYSVVLSLFLFDPASDCHWTTVVFLLINLFKSFTSLNEVTGITGFFDWLWQYLATSADHLALAANLL